MQTLPKRVKAILKVTKFLTKFQQVVIAGNSIAKNMIKNKNSEWFSLRAKQKTPNKHPCTSIFMIYKKFVITGTITLFTVDVVSNERNR